MSISNPATEKQKNVLARAGYSTTELEGLSVSQASKLLDYVSRNNWKRPNVAQVEAIAAGEVLEEDKAARQAIIMARIPTSAELDEFTKGMSPAKGLAIDEAMDDLKYAVQKGQDALILHGQALGRLKAECKHGEWKKLLKLLGVPRTTAHRQIQLAAAHGRIDAKLRKTLEFKGIMFRSTMTAREVRIAQKAAEVAEDAEKEAQMFHRETFDPGDDDFQASVRSHQRHAQIEVMVEKAVGEFIDSQLQKKPPRAQGTSTGGGHLLLAGAQSTESIARDIATLVMERLDTLGSSQRRREVWNLVVEYVEADAGVEVNGMEVANATT